MAAKASGSELVFTPLLRARCPCGSEVTIGFSEGAPTVLHPLPTCALFDRFESPVDYVHYLNLLLEHHATQNQPSKA